MCQESGERHIADIKNSRGLVIELQNSSISQEEANSREKFYQNMLWVVNAKKFWKNITLGCRIPSPESYVYEQYNVVPTGENYESFLIQMSGTKVSRDELVETWGSQKVNGWEDYENGQFTYAFKWSNPRSIWLARSCKQYWDIGEDILFEVVKCGENGLIGLSTISKKRFIKENDGIV